ncbi:MAG TPA: hypothetical protein VD766_02850, partial [Solirubrobacterales bacterium]|nr:hypothetical protein [Solirubrobacterales bacterium]
LSAPVAAGSGCIQSKVNVARCSVGPITTINVDAGDLDDRGTIGDTVDALVGGNVGNDELISKNGDVTFDGGAGNDTIQPGKGTDSIGGGIGADTVTYADRGTEEAVTVDIDGAADDGNVDDLGTGGGDNVLTDMERIVGGAGGDDLRGSSIANRLTGGGGPDELRGLGGIDTILAAGDGQIDNVLCGGGSADHAFADPTDTVATSGPERCELVN